MAVVLLKGALHGADREAVCDLLAWRAEGSTVLYSQMRVIDAPLDLPDGVYKLVVDDKVYTTEKCQGWWHMVNLDAGV